MAVDNKHKILTAFLCVLAFAGSTLARDVSRSENPNLYNFPTTEDPGSVATPWDTSVKQRIFPTINGTTGIFPTIGQSRIANNSSSPATPYTPTNGSKCVVLNPYDGFYYIANDPILGATATVGFFNAGWHARLCDKLITAGKYTQVIFAPMARSGASIADFVPGGAYAPRIPAVSAMLTAMGITPTAWLLQIGTTDCVAGMSQATFTADARAVIAYQRSQPGRSSDKWSIAQDTINGTTNTTCTTIRAAQAAVAGDANNTLGPDADTLTYSTFSDGTHFNDTGNNGMANLWSAKIQANY